MSTALAQATDLVLVALPVTDSPHPGVIVGHYPTVHAADAAVDRLYTAAVRGELAIYDRQSGWHLTRPIVTVRDADHPRIAQARPGHAAYLLPGTGTTDEVAAYRRWGYAHGLEGRGGGWVWRVGATKPICQGWTKLRTSNPANARVLTLDGKYRVVRAVVTTL